MLRAAVFVSLLLPALIHATPPRHEIDSRTIQRHGKGYRYNQAGWIVVHIEGDPYERGVQHGRLLAFEIAGHLRCFAAVLGHKSPVDAWKNARTLTNALFLRGYDEEYLAEMKGIADGASDAGARIHGRRIDVLDIATLNGWMEIETLDHGLNALPTALDGLRFDKQPKPKLPAKPEHCSAFAATGPATKDGKIVFGHITMFGLYQANFFNVWLDVKPSKGHRVLMHSFPGGIHSSMDYYLNDAGLMISETTIAQTPFDGKGTPLASRIRKAMQYADSIDKAIVLMEKDNNGLYTNEWLLGDTKTNEIAMFELGTKKSKLWRSSKDEWFGGTKGFYWGCNNTKDLEVRLETIASTKDKPANVVFAPSDRDRKWLQLYDKHKGKIDESFGKLAFTTGPLCAFSSLDAKFTTTDMAKKLETWAIFGPPRGNTWEPTFDQQTMYPEIRPLVSHPWTILTAQEPSAADATKTEQIRDLPGASATEGFWRDPDLATAYRGTLLPKTDGDIWLATGFAAYERIAALKSALNEQYKGKPPAEAEDRLANALFGHRAGVSHAVAAWKDVPLGKITSDLRQHHWHRLATGKGVLALNALHTKLGDDKFLTMMDEFGTTHGGKEVTTEQFRAHAEKASGEKLGEFFGTWLEKPGLPGATDADRRARTVLTFYPEVEETIIVYGTLDEEAANRASAVALEKSLRRRGSNLDVPIKTDAEVTEAELKNNHLLLVGRPATNRIAAKVQLPVTFGPASVKVRQEIYAHADTAIVTATASPFNARYSVVVIAGLQAAATLRAAESFGDRASSGGEVLVLRPGRAVRALTIVRP